MDEEAYSVSGPVEEADGGLVLMIPLCGGGDKFIDCSRGISRIEGEYLRIDIPEWLAGMLRIAKGQQVSVDNQGGKFNIRPIDPMPLQ